jgi:hypothetical protein
MRPPRFAALEVVKEWGSSIPASLLVVIERVIERRDQEWANHNACTCKEHPTLGFRPSAECPTHAR